MGKLARGGLAAMALKWASRLRFPWLFLLTAGLFALNLVIPDALPFADEILMGLVALLLAGLKKKTAREDSPARAENDEGNTGGAA